MTTRAARAHRAGAVSEAKSRPGHGRPSPHQPAAQPATWAWRQGDTRGGEVVALTSALTLTAATVEISLRGHLGLFFDVCFVLVCLAGALKVRSRDFFTVGVLPPMLMCGTMLLVALNGTQVIADRHDSVVQAVITGLARHSLALFVGYAVCLVTLVLRQRSGR